jgi:hypothetical protein
MTNTLFAVLTRTRLSFAMSRSVQGREDEEENHDWVNADIRFCSVQGWLEDDRHGQYGKVRRERVKRATNGFTYACSRRRHFATRILGRYDTELQHRQDGTQHCCLRHDQR